MKKILVLFAICGLFFSCNNSNEANGSSTNVEEKTSNTPSQQLNMIVVLDLSDRIDPNTHPASPTHKERDIEAIQNIVKIFKKEMERKGAFNAKGSLQVLFFPQPADPNIGVLANKLDIDLNGKSNQQKKEIFDNIENTFTESLNEIYNRTIESQNWVGSDIWRFFKNNIDLYIKDDYRNVFVIVTDGYIYYQNSVQRDNHRYSYLTGRLLNDEKLRDPNTYLSRIKSLDFGLLTTRKNLQNIEVLFLELEPNPKYLIDFDIMELVLKQWCNEMGVQKVSVYKTDLPTNTKKAIDKFLLEP